jgi:hypothetical protein
MQGKVFVDGKLVAEAIISCAVVDRPSQPATPPANTGAAGARDNPKSGDSPK